MSNARYSHTASLLADGSVIAIGGNGGSSSLATAEIYNETQNTWIAVPGMNIPRRGHTAEILSDGGVGERWNQQRAQ